jgi:hypothetical protein
LFVLPENLPIALTPFAFLIGEWRGTGIVSYPSSGDADADSFEFEFEQQVSFEPGVGEILTYRAETRSVTGAGLASECGYWTLAKGPHGELGPGLLPATGESMVTVREDLELHRNASGGFDIQALIIQSSGICELYFGEIGAARAELATDAVLRSPTAGEYSAGRRLFGLVSGELLWAWDMAALGQPMGSHASEKLRRVS